MFRRVLIAHLIAWVILAMIGALLTGISMLMDGTNLKTVQGILTLILETPVLLGCAGLAVLLLTLVVLFLDGGGKRDPLAEHKPRFDLWLGGG